MMDEDVKVIDLLDLAKTLYSCKLFIVGCAIVGGVAGFGYAYKTVVPTYQSSIDVKLPLYCDNNTIGTAVTVARGTTLLNGVSQKLGISNGRVAVIPVRTGSTSLIHVTIRGGDPQLIKNYADVYQGDLVRELDSFINEKTINDMQRANLSAANPLPREELMSRMALGRAEVIKEAEVPTGRIDEGYEKKTVYGVILGLMVGVGISALKYLKKVLLDSPASPAK